MSAEAAAQPLSAWGRLQAFRARHARAEALLFFIGGFAYDIVFASRIDDRVMLATQGGYLVLLGALIGVEHHASVRQEAMPAWFQRLPLREVTHFLFGSLLSAFLFFYFKAASGLVSFAFLLALFALLVGNELERFRRLGPIMRVALWSFALTSYLAYLLPVLVGSLRPWLFLAAVALSSLGVQALWMLFRRFTPDPRWTFQRAVLPGLAAQALLVGLFLSRALPPVPLALEWIGIYHDVQRQGGKVLVRQEQPPWRFWERGDQLFRAREGDKIFCFARIFAPRHFKDRLYARFWYREKAGWTRTDAIPLTISGGRKEGWTGVAYKQNYAPGAWRAAIETEDGREVGSVRFEVVTDDSSGERFFHEVYR